MLDYYPNVIRSIKEFRAIVDGEYPEFEALKTARDRVIDDAYLTTMTEDRIIEWEKALKITPPLDSTIENRRDVIIARMRGQGKLNTALINLIVKTFTGGTAESWYSISDNTLYINILLPSNDKVFNLDSVIQELDRRVPAHLGLSVQRVYASWDQIENRCATWNDVKTTYDTWQDVYVAVNSNSQSASVAEGTQTLSLNDGSTVDESAQRLNLNSGTASVSNERLILS